LRRIQWIEIHDQPWFPASLRDAVTDTLELALHFGNNYGAIVPRLRGAISRAGATGIVDLCSGGGGPWPRMAHLFARAEKEEQAQIPKELPMDQQRAVFPLCLTDKFPNRAALERARAASQKRIDFRGDAVDATAVPADLDGFRTLFTSFHHFRPAEARAILRDAVEKRVGIGVFEVTHRSARAVLLFCLAPLGFLILAPFTRPFRWSRLLWTYLIPVLPLVGLHDGIVSCLRTYSPEELRKMTQGLADGGYSWEAGEEQGPRSPLPITYLIGVPTAR
jgi:hypothetical protein